MLRPEPLDFVIIALVAMLLFGANRLPESARSIGKAIREFRAAVTGQDGSNAPKEVSSPNSSSVKAETGIVTAVSCRQCGKPLRPGMKFCPECGSAQ